MLKCFDAYALDIYQHTANREVCDKMSDPWEIDETMLIFGGPYSNYAATVAMRNRVTELGIPAERVICTGDIIAYCGEPCDTLDLIRDWGIHVVMGNCEESLAHGEADCGCGFEPDSECSVLAVTWYEYSNRRVTAAQRRWMSELPRRLDFAMSSMDFRVVHASLNSINEFVFASSEPEARLSQIRNAGVDVVIGGHSGIPFGQQLEERYWLNAGVIGMPANDGGTHGWYLLLEPGESGINASWHQLDYDYSSSRESTVAAGMGAYGNALADGLWPSIDILPAVEAQQTGKPLNLESLRIEPTCHPRRVNSVR
jgi:predicted phosphodiesterase